MTPQAVVQPLVAAPAALDTHRFHAFGGAACEVHAVRCGADALSQVVADVYAFEGRLTRFDAASELSLLNSAAGTARDVSPLLEALLRAALHAAELSGGLVNAAVLPALRAAGYDRTIAEVRRRIPSMVAAEPVVVPLLPHALEVGAGWARVRRGCAVDLGGVGKGWLADHLAERLGNAAVVLGGDLRAQGDGPDGAGWTVGLCDTSTLAVIDAGVATSGVVGRRWPGGHHLVDPRSGAPAITDVDAVSVVAATALDAEILAKGAAILGSAAGPPWAQARGALAVTVVTSPGATR